MRISGVPAADFYAATSGTDSDWVVKLIDVYPDMLAARAGNVGLSSCPSRWIFSAAAIAKASPIPRAIPANTPQHYRFTLTPTNHTFLPGHRIMVQIQSSWFPLYDRNPQTFVPNIFQAHPQDYKAATQTIFHGGSQASAILLPVAEAK